MIDIAQNILAVLEQKQFCCLDNAAERKEVAAALAAALNDCEHRKRVYVAALIEDNDRYLVRCVPFFFAPPTGCVKDSESVMDGLARTLADTCGIASVEGASLLGIFEGDQDGVTFLFHVPLVGPVVNKQEELSPWRWLTEQEIIEACPPGYTSPLYGYLRGDYLMPDLLTLLPGPTSAEEKQANNFNDLFRWFVYRTDRHNPQVQVADCANEWQDFFEVRNRDVVNALPFLHLSRDAAIRSAGWEEAALIRRHVSERDTIEFMKSLRTAREGRISQG